MDDIVTDEQAKALAAAAATVIRNAAGDFAKVTDELLYLHIRVNDILNRQEGSLRVIEQFLLNEVSADE